MEIRHRRLQPLPVREEMRIDADAFGIRPLRGRRSTGGDHDGTTEGDGTRGFHSTRGYGTPTTRRWRDGADGHRSAPPTLAAHESRGAEAIDIAVLVSGSGSNLQALIDRLDPSVARIVLVLSDKPSAYGLERAAAAGIATTVVEWGGDRVPFTTAVCDAVERSGAEAMVLAGFMRILGSEAIERFRNRIINIHPSLLPSFPGARAVEDALAYGVKTTGVTVHFVDEKVDHGPIISQHPVPVEPDDTVESLHGRIQEQEHLRYPQVVEAFCAGRLDIDGRKVIWR